MAQVWNRLDAGFALRLGRKGGLDVRSYDLYGR